MVKLAQTKGFTLIEMLLVLGMLSMIVMLIPLAFIHQSKTLFMQVETLRYQLQSYQIEAIMNKKVMQIIFEGKTMYVNDTPQAMEIRCSGSLSFNEQGNVNQAMSIACFDDRFQNELIIQLGSGRMYVK